MSLEVTRGAADLNSAWSGGSYQPVGSQAAPADANIQSIKSSASLELAIIQPSRAEEEAQPSSAPADLSNEVASFRREAADQRKTRNAGIAAAAIVAAVVAVIIALQFVHGSQPAAATHGPSAASAGKTAP